MRNDETVVIPLIARIILAPFMWCSWVYQRLFGVIKPMELILIDSVRGYLSDTDRAIFDSQLKQINFSKRTTAKNTTETIYYKIKLFGADLNREIYFSDTSEKKMATVKLLIKGVLNLEAIFWLYDGKFFSIEFNKDVMGYLDSKDIKIEEVVLWR